MVSLYPFELLVYSVLFVYPNTAELNCTVRINTVFLSLTPQFLSQILTLSLRRSLFKGGGYWESSRRTEQNRGMQTYNGKNKDKLQRNLTDHSSLKLLTFLDIKHWRIAGATSAVADGEASCVYLTALKMFRIRPIPFPLHSVTGDTPPPNKVYLLV